jgi:DNA primase
LDSDEAGMAAMNKLGKRLKKRIQVFVALLEKGKDPADLTEKELTDIYNYKRLVYM